MVVVAISVFELHLPGARSLKEKRSVVRSLVDRLHRRQRISILESGHLELHQRSEIAIALVARSGAEADRLLDRIRETVEVHPNCELIRWEPEVLSPLS